MDGEGNRAGVAGVGGGVGDLKPAAKRRGRPRKVRVAGVSDAGAADGANVGGGRTWSFDKALGLGAVSTVGDCDGAEVLEVGVRNMVSGLEGAELEAWRRLVSAGDDARRKRDLARKAEKFEEMTSGYAGSGIQGREQNAWRKRGGENWKSAKEKRKWERESKVVVPAGVARLLLWRSVGGSYRSPGPGCAPWKDLAAALPASEDVRSAWEENQRLCAERMRGKCSDLLESAVDGEEVNAEGARTSRWLLERLESDTYGDPRYAGQGNGNAAGAGGGSGGLVINIVADAAASLSRKPASAAGRAVVMEGV